MTFITLIRWCTLVEYFFTLRVRVTLYIWNGCPEFDEFGAIRARAVWLCFQLEWCWICPVSACCGWNPCWWYSHLEREQTNQFRIAWSVRLECAFKNGYSMGETTVEVTYRLKFEGSFYFFILLVFSHLSWWHLKNRKWNVNGTAVKPLIVIFHAVWRWVPSGVSVSLFFISISIPVCE